MHRRDFFKATGAAAVSLLGNVGAVTARGGTATLGGTERAFDYAWLKGEARGLASRAYRPPANTVPTVLRDLDWDQYQSITFRGERALWALEGVGFEVKFFHLGLFYQTPVHMYEVTNGRAKEIAYDPAMFDYGKSGLAGARFPPNLGFAGFRVNTARDLVRDVVAFLGAAYFRAVGGELQYGLSARGLAIDSGMSRPEEFPVFISFWFERPRRGSTTLTVYALMDSESVAGAYRFIMKPGRVFVMDIDAALYPRREMERMGVAPLTSMYQYGENDHRMDDDWRPEIHDSDGLSMWTGAGEWIWRPLSNPETMRFSAFQDENPRGFGLLQRDRNFDHYQDDGIFYDRRPSLWVEPKRGWGKGSVELIELPAADETSDNIVAFWNPVEKPRAGEELLFAYRLSWGSKMPAGPSLAEVVATRTGIGGIVGQKRTHYSRRFVVDFAGGGLAHLAGHARVEPVISTSRGRIELPSARPLTSVRGYRAMFDVRLLDDDAAPIDLRLFLRAGDRALTETWLYQWTPPPPSLRGATRMCER